MERSVDLMIGVFLCTCFWLLFLRAYNASSSLLNPFNTRFINYQIKRVAGAHSKLVTLRQYFQAPGPLTHLRTHPLMGTGVKLQNVIASAITVGILFSVFKSYKFAFVYKSG